MFLLINQSMSRKKSTFERRIASFLVTFHTSSMVLRSEITLQTWETATYCPLDASFRIHIETFLIANSARFHSGL